MKRTYFGIRGIATILALSITLAGPAVAHAQQISPELGIGYVVNAPNMFLGFNTYILSTKWGGLGLYADAKFDLDSAREKQNFNHELTVQTVEDEIGDLFFSEDVSWQSFNLALIRPISPQLMVYAGAGYARKHVYWEYFDDSRTRGLEGFYWVEHEGRKGAEANLLGGALFGIREDISLQFGIESSPRGATVGVTYATPFFR